MTAVQTESLVKRFGALVVVDDVSLSLGAGERRAIIGPNGAGKTTLFNLLSGDITQSSGSISILGVPQRGMSPAKRSRAGLRRTYQSSEVFDELTILENLTLAALGPMGRTRNPLRTWKASQEELETADHLAGRVGLGGSSERLAKDLSHGERRQLELGMALSREPKILLLDEPAAGLSPVERTVLSSLLSEIDRSITVLMIEHDMEIALKFADLVTVLANGKEITTGSADEIVADQRVQEVYLGREVTE